MCGIVGFVDFSGKFLPERVRGWTLAMREALAHRGPDDAGLWQSPDGRVCLGHRRLAIVDLRPEGRQPMGNEDGNVVATFNGEIYNYRELTDKLQAKGHTFRTRTDTEVLCHLFERDPLRAVVDLEGMFALGIWRNREKELVLARDPFGKKPLYFGLGTGFLAFASELHCLEILPGLADSLDEAALQEYLLLQYVHAPRTIHARCSKLEPGCLLRFRLEQGHLRQDGPHRFFSFRPGERGSEPGPRGEQAVEELRDHLIPAVRSRLMGDVPLGAFLSGGLDSSLVTAIATRELGLPTKTFSIGFEDAPDSEHLAAREIASHLGTDHHELLVAPSAVELLPRIVGALDEPNGDSSCLPVHLLSAFTRRKVTVALSGDGGDELFGGYARYGQALAEESRPPRVSWLLRFGKWWNRSDAYLMRAVPGLPFHLLGPLLGRWHADVLGLVDGWRESLGNPAEPFLQAMRRHDVESYLPGSVLAKVDRMSMHCALEVRCPLLDLRLARWAERLPPEECHDGRVSKGVLRRLAARYLPAHILQRPKQGFGLPERAWSKGKLLEMAHDLLLDPRSPLGSRLRIDPLRRFLARQDRAFNVYWIWGLLVLECWLRRRTEGAAAAWRKAG